MESKELKGRFFQPVEVRVKRISDEGKEWKEIAPLTFKVCTDDQADVICEELGQAAEVWEVRWNYPVPAGLGQGHYLPGAAMRARYPWR